MKIIPQDLAKILSGEEDEQTFEKIIRKCKTDVLQTVTHRQRRKPADDVEVPELRD